MITRDNIKEVLNNLKPAEIQKAEEEPGDFFVINLHVFNVGFFTTIEGREYCQEEEQAASDNGNLFIDRSEFFRIFEETTGRTI